MLRLQSQPASLNPHRQTIIIYYKSKFEQQSASKDVIFLVLLLFHTHAELKYFINLILDEDSQELQPSLVKAKSLTGSQQDTTGPSLYFIVKYKHPGLESKDWILD